MLASALQVGVLGSFPIQTTTFIPSRGLYWCEIVWECQNPVYRLVIAGHGLEGLSTAAH